MGDLDSKPFHEATKGEFSGREAAQKALELCSLWEDQLRDRSWHPFQVIADKEGKSEEIINEDDENLRSLKSEHADEVFNAVETALKEMNGYNPSGRYIIPELWNFKEDRKAILSEGQKWQALDSSIVTISFCTRQTRLQSLAFLESNLGAYTTTTQTHNNISISLIPGPTLTTIFKFDQIPLNFKPTIPLQILKLHNSMDMRHEGEELRITTLLIENIEKLNEVKENVFEAFDVHVHVVSHVPHVCGVKGNGARVVMDVAKVKASFNN
ncbi:unnamed protein product [Dovyalis caffra]|uniref:Factor of DNA methylation 1-5/IDN2 domain-containing protein n=1 Tax=Dovyalis caffra TaxID=77055 RepID=A0AAV1RD84_9ROSI|nr:unnamed protein product [Dovyalis caffra]